MAFFREFSEFKVVQKRILTLQSSKSAPVESRVGGFESREKLFYAVPGHDRGIKTLF